MRYEPTLENELSEAMYALNRARDRAPLTEDQVNMLTDCRNKIADLINLINPDRKL